MAENTRMLNLDRDLEHIQTQVMKMGGLVEAAILSSAKALEDRDTELAEQILRQDEQIDTLEQAINEECARVISLRGPAAKDLRMVLTIMKVSNNLERCGDLAKNIAKRTTVLAQMQPVEGIARSIRRMAREVEIMLKDVLDSYVQGSADLAEDVRERDVDVDQMYNSLFRELLTHMMEDPRNITACMHLHFIAKNIERMGDHCTSIGEHVIYQVTGDFPEDVRIKKDRTSFETMEQPE